MIHQRISKKTRQFVVDLFYPNIMPLYKDVCIVPFNFYLKSMKFTDRQDITNGRCQVRAIAHLDLGQDELKWHYRNSPSCVIFIFEFHFLDVLLSICRCTRPHIARPQIHTNKNNHRLP
jgi:hypothetical protein